MRDTINHHLMCGLFFVLFLPTALLAVGVPPLRGRVNDYAQLLSSQQSASLERLLSKFEQETGHQVVILTIPSLAGENIEGFGIRLADTWKIGKKGFDNGVILIVAQQDRKLRLEVGYGLEGVLPDAVASRILRDFIIPRFRAQDYSGGIVAGTEAVLKVIRREPLPATARKTAQNAAPVAPLVILAIVLAFFGILVAFSPKTRRRSDIWGTHGSHYTPMGWGGRFRGSGGFGGGGGFSGGGGGFGGGGASGSW